MFNFSCIFLVTTHTAVAGISRQPEDPRNKQCMSDEWWYDANARCNAMQWCKSSRSNPKNEALTKPEPPVMNASASRRTKQPLSWVLDTGRINKGEQPFGRIGSKCQGTLEGRSFTWTGRWCKTTQSHSQVSWVLALKTWNGRLTLKCPHKQGFAPSTKDGYQTRMPESVRDVPSLSIRGLPLPYHSVTAQPSHVFPYFLSFLNNFSLSPYIFFLS